MTQAAVHRLFDRNDLEPIVMGKSRDALKGPANDRYGRGPLIEEPWKDHMSQRDVVVEFRHEVQTFKISREANKLLHPSFF